MGYAYIAPRLLLEGVTTGTSNWVQVASHWLLSNDAVIYMGAATDVVLSRLGANALQLQNGTAGQIFNVGPAGNVIGLVGSVAGAAPYIQSIEGTAPSAPGANSFRIFAQDNGAGKTQLAVLFATGAAQVIATEP